MSPRTNRRLQRRFPRFSGVPGGFATAARGSSRAQFGLLRRQHPRVPMPAAFQSATSAEMTLSAAFQFFGKEAEDDGVAAVAFERQIGAQQRLAREAGLGRHALGGDVVRPAR